MKINGAKLSNEDIDAPESTIRSRQNRLRAIAIDVVSRRLYLIDGYRRITRASIENYDFCWIITFIFSIMPSIHNFNDSFTCF